MKSTAKLLPLLFLLIAMWMQGCKDDVIDNTLSLPNENTQNLKSAKQFSLLGKFDGNVPISRFLIIGTYESGMRLFPGFEVKKSEFIPSDINSKGSIKYQLEHSVRFLDIRCRNCQDALLIYHNDQYLNQTFTETIQTCETFLKKNPYEFIIMSVKEEWKPYRNTLSFAKVFDSYVAKNPKLWYLGTTVPKLSEVHGKIVLVRRFESSTPKGLNECYSSEYLQDIGETNFVAFDKWDLNAKTSTFKKSWEYGDDNVFNIPYSVYEYANRNFLTFMACAPSNKLRIFYMSGNIILRYPIYNSTICYNVFSNSLFNLCKKTQMENCRGGIMLFDYIDGNEFGSLSEINDHNIVPILQDIYDSEDSIFHKGWSTLKF